MFDFVTNADRDPDDIVVADAVTPDGDWIEVDLSSYVRAGAKYIVAGFSFEDSDDTQAAWDVDAAAYATSTGIKLYTGTLGAAETGTVQQVILPIADKKLYINLNSAPSGATLSATVTMHLLAYGA